MTNPLISASVRWLEFYSFRYATGSVVGVLVFFFICLINPAMTPLLFGAENGVIDWPRIALFAAYGLAYCYISSAPMLVFHSSRYMLDLSRVSFTTLSRFFHGEIGRAHV